MMTSTTRPMTWLSANNDVHVRLHIGVAGHAHGGNLPAFEANVSHDDAPVVNDERIQHDRVYYAFDIGALRLNYGVASGFAEPT